MGASKEAREVNARRGLDSRTERRSGPMSGRTVAADACIRRLPDWELAAFMACARSSPARQEVDLVSLFEDVVHHFVHQCAAPSAARHLVDRALRIAIAERTVTCPVIPNDVQQLEYAELERSHGHVFSALGYSPPMSAVFKGDSAGWHMIKQSLAQLTALALVTMW
jgi:hypothetical protein